MLLIEQEFDIPRCGSNKNLIKFFRDAVERYMPAGQVPVRFAVTSSNDEKWHCELGVITGDDRPVEGEITGIFDFDKRSHENTDNFTAVLLVPTGIGSEIGGHAGDAAPVAKLLASACDTLITHPNVVNASDLNELSENGLYVEGSVISDMLMGTVGLQKVRSNRVLLVIDKHKLKPISDSTINAVSAARAAMGMDCPKVIELDPPIKMRARYSTSGSAVGRVEGVEYLCEVLEKYRDEYDAVALASVIDVPSEFHTSYFKSKGEMVNPWGGVEAMLTHAITKIFGIPAAHSPMFESMEIANLEVGVVDPRMSAEAISACFLHCILKGLHKSPRIIADKKAFGRDGIISAADVSCLVIPDGCVGLPTLAAMEQGIPVIAVKENKNRMKNKLEELPFKDGKLFIVENYLEAVGVMTSLKAGVAVSSVRRPLAFTKVITETVAKGQTEADNSVSSVNSVAKS
jgi:hypothetical protein